MVKSFVIAIDGPSSSGKSTLSKKLASYYGLLHLDTGILYRAVAYKMIINNINFSNESKAVNFAKKLTFQGLNPSILTNNKIAIAASKIAIFPNLRNTLIDIQRKIAKNPNGAILDGRDIGTTVCPNADFKFYVFAGLEERALRCYRDKKKIDRNSSYKEIIKDLEERDNRDINRSFSPLTIGKDAYLLNTTKLSIEQVFKNVCSLIDKKYFMILKNKENFYHY